MIFHFWFCNPGFKFQDSVCNGCHDLTILCLNISNIAIITVAIVALFITLANMRQLRLMPLVCISSIQSGSFETFSHTKTWYSSKIFMKIVLFWPKNMQGDLIYFNTFLVWFFETFSPKIYIRKYLTQFKHIKTWYSLKCPNTSHTSNISRPKYFNSFCE